MTKLTKELPIAGEVFGAGDCPAFVINPAEMLEQTRPWVWYAPTLPGLPGVEEVWMFEQFLHAGIAIAGVDVGESFGSPKGRALYSDFYRMMLKRGFSKKPGLLARSRGGLMLYNWAVEHPDCVACVAGIYPVCNLLSYPGLAKACGAYEMTEAQLGACLSEHNPIDRVEPLAKARVPIYHIHGDVDVLVPLDKNSAMLAHRYHLFGGPMILNVVEGQGHNMWTGWFQCQELVDFVIGHVGPMKDVG